MTITVERGQRLPLVLEAMGRLGDTLAQHQGKPVFVIGGIPGEEVVAEVIRERRQYIAAQVVEVVTSSPHRVAAPCRYVGECTGCQWQHVSYDHQLTLKREAVVDALDRIGGLTHVEVLSTLPAEHPYGYRNHARFTIGPQGRLGFVHRERRRFVDIDECLLMHPWINQALGQLQGRCDETTQLSIRYGPDTGSWLIQPTLKRGDIPLKTGQKHYQDSLGGVSFRVAASSFFQVNNRQAERLAELMRVALQLSGREVVVDAYAGVGTFAALLAPHAARVIAIEESLSAIKDGWENLAGFRNVEMRHGKTEEVLEDLDVEVDSVVVDPPRVGCDPGALESLMRLAPSRLVYVSCDPSTLSRDLKVLSDGPYTIESVQPVDMFPQTHHVECIAVLALSASSPAPSARAMEAVADRITLASASPRRSQILERAGISVRVVPSGVEETAMDGEPEAQVETLARKKAQAVASTVATGLVLGADTVVVDGETVLGKPINHQDALQMLRRLRGGSHRVLTGVAVVDAVSGRTLTASRESRVAMRPYSDGELAAYVASGEVWDKAGSYAIQDPAFAPVATVEGCYLNVVGLPLCLAVSLMKELGMSLDTVVGPEECRDCPLREVG